MMIEYNCKYLEIPLSFTEEELSLEVAQNLCSNSVLDTMQRTALTGSITANLNTLNVGGFPYTYPTPGSIDIGTSTTFPVVDSRDEKIKALEQEVSSLKKDMDFMYDKFEQVRKELIEMIRVNTALQEKHVRGGYWEENS